MHAGITCRAYGLIKLGKCIVSKEGDSIYKVICGAVVYQVEDLVNLVLVTLITKKVDWEEMFGVNEMWPQVSF
jgi:hypothetical protein